MKIFSMFKAEVNLYIQIRENDFMKSSADVLLNQHIMHSVSVWSLRETCQQLVTLCRKSNWNWSTCLRIFFQPHRVHDWASILGNLYVAADCWGKLFCLLWNQNWIYHLGRRVKERGWKGLGRGNDKIQILCSCYTKHQRLFMSIAHNRTDGWRKNR